MTDLTRPLARLGAALVVLAAGCGTADGTGSPAASPTGPAATPTGTGPAARPSAPASPTLRKVMTKPTAKPSARPSGTAPAQPGTGPSPTASASPAAPTTPPAAELPMLGMGVNFRLSDQFDKPHSVQFPREQPTVLAFGDKDGSSQIEGWIKPLYDRYTDRIDIQGVAQLDMVPAFARGMVRGIMGSLTKNPVMLDWDGTVSRAFGYTGGGRAGIYVLDGDGGIRWRSAGAATAPGLTEAQGVIDQLLSE